MPSQGKVKISELQVNQEYENLLPLLLDEDLKNLEKSILKDGILHPFIINPDKVVLDGHHRLIICQRHSINEVPVIERSFNSDLEEMEFVISFNLHRRHLTMTQKVELGVTIKKMEMEKARRRQIEAGKLFGEKHPKEEVPPILAEALNEEQGEAMDIAAEKDPEVYFDRIFENGKKTYCKYCYKDVHIVPGDGIWECVECGAGLALLDGGSEERGEALEIAAKKVGLGKETLRKGEQILDAAKKDPEVYKSWQSLARGDGSISSIHERLIRKKEEEAEQWQPIQINPKLEGVFQVIVIDLPTFNLEKLKTTAIPFDKTNCVLWLWTSFKHLCDSLSLLVHWGFNVQTMLTWVKNKRSSGKWLLNQTEYCILAIRGNPIANSTSYSTALVATPGGHHSKPDEFFSLAESLSDGRRLFVSSSSAIKFHPGWEEFVMEANANEF